MSNEREASIIQGVSEDVFYASGEDSSWQYLGGDLVMEPAASFRHEDLSAFLNLLLRGWLEERGGGVVVGSRFAMRLDPQWSPEPDVLVVLKERLHRLGRQRLEGPANLVIEVASGATPSAQAIDLRRKLPRYREAKVPEIWLIDPFAKSVRAEVLVTTPDLPDPSDPDDPHDPHAQPAQPTQSIAGIAGITGTTASYHVRTLAAGRLDSAVVAGFWIDVAWLWQEPLPPALGCLRQILA
jgi:Uma2 family endonuclease